MAQWFRLGMWLLLAPPAIVAVGIAGVIEVVTGGNPLEDDDDGIQRGPYGPVRPAGGHRHGANNNCPCGRIHD